MAFTFEKTKLPGVVIIQPKVFGDNRGYFMETYKKGDFAKAGIDKEFVQDNESSSTFFLLIYYSLLIFSRSLQTSLIMELKKTLSKKILHLVH